MSATIDVLLNSPIGTIDPNVYGHFMEHLGACIYEGCWVGEDSDIPNTRGIRNDVVAALKAAKTPVIRWPGGCFADDYHWEDGIGAREKRPRRINIHWGNVIEPNSFGTHEFMDFCRAVGTEPYFCGNVGSGSPLELRNWVEYCNFAGDSTLAQTRAANGDPEPLAVRYWGVGNENWGCGGNFTPEDYGTAYRKFASFLRNWGGDPLYLIACGPNGNDADWTRRFFTKLRRDYWSGPAIQGYAAHYYCGTAGTATEYTEAQWYELLWKAIQMEPLVVQQRHLMDAFDPDRKIDLIVDEWGTWHPATPGHNPAFLWQQNTVRDALVAAMTLDIFNRHADKVKMANIAQTINVLQALILTDGAKMILTPTYYVYSLYADHQGGVAKRVEISAESVETEVLNQKRQVPVLSGSASSRDGKTTLTVVNAHASEVVTANVRLFGGGVGKALVSSLSYPQGDIRAHNAFDAPDVVGLSEAVEAGVSGGELLYSFPAASITKFVFEEVA